MITITNIRNVGHAAYDEVWAIVRSLKNPGNLRHVPKLSPSWELLKKIPAAARFWPMESRDVPKYLCSDIFAGNTDSGSSKEAK